MPQDLVSIQKEKQRKRLRELLTSLRSGASSIGQIAGQSILNTNIGEGATKEAGQVGGALQLGGLGLGMFGLPGLVGGGVLGSVVGGLFGGMEESRNNQFQRNEMRNRIYSRSIGDNTGLYGEGGAVEAIDGDQPVVPIQTSKPEVIIKADGRIVDVHSPGEHGELSKSQVTDIVRPEEYVISDKFGVTEVMKNRVIGYTPAVYEEGKGSVKMEEITLEDYTGKSTDRSLAEEAKVVRNRFKVKNQKIGLNFLDDITNQENISARRLPITAIIAENDRKRDGLELEDAKLVPQGIYQFGGSPFMNIMREGTLLDLLNDPEMLAEIAAGGASVGSFGLDSSPTGTGIQMSPGIDAEANQDGDNLMGLGIDTPGLDDIIGNAQSRLAQSREDAINIAAGQKENNKELFSDLNRNDIISFIGSTVGNLAQDRRPNVRLRRPEFLEERFRKLTPQEIAANADAMISTGANVVGQLQEAPDLVSSVAPSVFARLLNRSASVRSDAAKFNIQQDQARFNELASVNESNRNTLNQVDEINRQESNSAIAQGTQVLGNFLEGQNRRNINRNQLDQQSQAELRQALSNIDTQALALDVVNARNQSERTQAMRRLRQAKEAAKEYQELLRRLNEDE